MARNFDGADDWIDFGSDASIDAFSSKTFAAWVIKDDDAVERIGGKEEAGVTPTGWTLQHNRTAAVSTGHLTFRQDFTGTDGLWSSPNNGVPFGTLHEVGVTYDRGSTANDPVFYVDGVSVAVTETTPPTLNSEPDSAHVLRIGAAGDGSGDFDGRMMAFVYDNTLFTAAAMNRHRWWGMGPGGHSTMKVWHPLWSDSLANKGTATADGTANGTNMASIAKLLRAPALGGMWGW